MTVHEDDAMPAPLFECLAYLGPCPQDWDPVLVMPCPSFQAKHLGRTLCDPL